ncbi:MAG: O-antigen ligase family protein [Candidatus Falkowbacteria bacterium]
MKRDKLLQILDKARFWIVAAILVIVPIAFAWFMENMQIFDLNKLLFFRPLTLLLGLVLLAGVFLKGRLGWRMSLMWWLWSAVLALFALNSFVSGDPLYSFFGAYQRQQGIYSLLFYLLFFASIAGSVRGKEEINRLLVWVAVSAGLVSLYGTLQLLGLEFMKWSGDKTRIFSSLGQTNFLAHYLVMVLPLTIYALIFLAKGRYRSLVLIVLALELISFYGTYSRGGYIGLIVGLFLAAAAMTYIAKRLQKVFYYGLAIIAMAVMLLSWQYTAVVQSSIFKGMAGHSGVVGRFMSIFDPYNGSGDMRLKYWGSVLKEFSQTSWHHKLFGYGKDMQETVFIRYYQPEWGAIEKLNSFPDRAHNLVFDIWLEFGLVGLIIITMLAVYIILKSWRVARGQDWRQRWLVVALSAALGGYFGAALFSFPLTTHYVYYYFVLAALFVLSESPEKVIFVKMEPIVRKVLWVSLAIFSLLLVYQFEFCRFMADHYFLKTKIGEARGDFRMMLDNIELTRSWFPLDAYYREQYVYIYNNSMDAIGSKQSLQDAFINITSEIEGFSTGERGRYYVLSDIAHSYSLFGLYLDKKYYPEAAKAYEQMISLAPYLTVTYQDYGRMWMWAGEYDRAISLFKRGLSIMPYSVDPRVVISRDILLLQKHYFNSLLCDCYYAKQNWTKALGFCLEAEKQQADIGRNLKEIADIYRQLGDRQQTLLYLGKAIIADQSNADWPLEAAKLAQELGNRQKALKFAKNAVALNPNNQEALKLVAELQKPVEPARIDKPGKKLPK